MKRTVTKRNGSYKAVSIIMSNFRYSLYFDEFLCNFTVCGHSKRQQLFKRTLFLFPLKAFIACYIMYCYLTVYA